MFSTRKIGSYEFQYIDYEVTVRAKWRGRDERFGREPQYEVVVHAVRIGDDGSGTFYTSVEAPVRPSPSITDRLLGRRPPKTKLADLVAEACEEIRTKIDGMYADIGIHRDEDEFIARAEAEAAIESWVEVPTQEDAPVEPTPANEYSDLENDRAEE
jgi:hypothetical protein